MSEDSRRSEPCVNAVTLLGRIGTDPEFGSTREGASALSFRMATTEVWNDKQSGERREHVEWSSIVIYAAGADTLRPMLQKGTRVHVAGSLRTRKFVDKQKAERQITEIVATRIIPLDRLRPRDSAPQQASLEETR